MALSCQEHPDHSTFAEFIGRLGERLPRIFSEVLLVCHEEGLLGATHFALDGLKLPSNASREWSGKLADLRLKQQKLEAKLAETYRLNYGFVWRSLRRLGVPEHAVDDAVHDVFVVAARRLHEFEGRAALTSWLFAVAVRVAQHHRRAIARHARRRSALAQTVESSGPPKDAFARRDAVQTLLRLAANLGADEVMPKPLRRDILLPMADQLLRRAAKAA
jgi:DNA-directed RNA polymerase specialized sigma24 family protein